MAWTWTGGMEAPRHFPCPSATWPWPGAAARPWDIRERPLDIRERPLDIRERPLDSRERPLDFRKRRGGVGSTADVEPYLIMCLNMRSV